MLKPTGNKYLLSKESIKYLIKDFENDISEIELSNKSINEKLEEIEQLQKYIFDLKQIKIA